MPDLSYHVRKAPDGTRVVELSGFINASTAQAFEQILSRLVELKPPRVIFDFSQVSYINSMGIAGLLNLREDLEQQGGKIALAEVDREVAVTMRLLGLTEMVPLYGSVKAALKREKPLPAAASSAPGRPRPVVVDRDQATVIMVIPREDPFTDVCRMRLERGNAAFRIVHDTETGAAQIREQPCDLLILEDRTPGAEEFLSEVKGHLGQGLMSVLKLYPHGTDLGRYADFKIWENDYLVEPFEVRELFVMAERELMRVPRERRQILHQSHFRFRSTGVNMGRAASLLEQLIAQVGFDEHSAIKVLSAVKEAVDNAVRHGHRNDEKKLVDVVVEVHRDRVQITVTDQGKGFDWAYYLGRVQGGDAYKLARSAKKEGKRGGLGIKIMHECCDKLEYIGRGNQVRLTKNIPVS